MKRKPTITTFGREMYGGRPHFSTHDALMHQNLAFNIIQQTFKKGSLINLDASKCFDKIYPKFSNISLQRIGVHPNISLVFSKTTKNMQHQINTAYGTLPLTLQDPNNKIFSGVGQGNSDAGVTWLASERIILNAFQQHFHPGQIFSDPQNQIHHKSSVIAFVDNNNIISTNLTKSTKQIFNDINRKCIHWKQYLETMGGIINDDKTHIYAWKWTLRQNIPTSINIPLQKHITNA